MKLKAWCSRKNYGRMDRLWHFVVDCQARQLLLNPIETEMDANQIRRLLKTEVCRECQKLSRRAEPGYVLLGGVPPL